MRTDLILKNTVGATGLAGLTYYVFKNGLSSDNHSVTEKLHSEHLDRSLRKVENNYMIPHYMQEATINVPECKELNARVRKCAQDSDIKNPIYIRNQCEEAFKALEECWEENFKRKDIYEAAKEQYLQEKAEFDKTGVLRKKREQIIKAVENNEVLVVETGRDLAIDKFFEETVRKAGKEHLYGFEKLPEKSTAES